MEFLRDIEVLMAIQLSVCSGSCILAFVLLLIKIPQTEYTKKMRMTKNTIALSFLICSFLLGFALFNKDIAHYEQFSSLMMLIAVSYSSIAISYSMTNLLDSKYTDGTAFVTNVFFTATVSIVLITSFMNDNHTIRNISIVTMLLLFVGQCVYYIFQFDKAYKSAVRQLEAFYDEEEDHKIRWIRFCYVIAMLTDVFLLVYLMLPKGLMTLYVAWYMLYMLYFSSNFISFLGSHKMTLDAFAHRTLSGQDMFPQKQEKSKKEVTAAEVRRRAREFEKLEKRIDLWVENKKYREYDKSREEIAAELSTTKETLQLYFNVQMGMDFRTWRTNLRIQDAKQMLLEKPECSTNMIGELCGFSDRSNFHRQFTKIVGCSPKVWRETDGHPENI